MTFPGNVVDLLLVELVRTPTAGASLTPQQVFGRPLRPVDPSYSIGVFELYWEPLEYEIGGMEEPGISSYHYTIQAMTKHANEVSGRSEHSVFSKSIRSMLYRDHDIRVGLPELSGEELGATERFSRLMIERQRFYANEVSRGTFLFVSSLDFKVEVQGS